LFVAGSTVRRGRCAVTAAASLFMRPLSEIVGQCYCTPSLARENRIESRIASRGNRTPGGCQAPENIAATRDDLLATLHCVSFTPAHNMVRQCSAAFGQFCLILLETLEHVVSVHWHTVALTCKLVATSYRDCGSILFRTVFRLSNVEMGARN
jgi:hypothetical protein